MVSSFNFDIDLLKRFDKPGPRYTSYPTAPLFSADYSSKDLESDLISNNQNADSPLSLYLHIPFCDTLCYFCGCTTVITNNRSTIKKYLHALKIEIHKVASHFKKERPVVQLHWGGGTPSYLEPAEIREINAHIGGLFNFTDHAEISVEIDPRGLTFDHLSAFRAGGVNRVSIGVQDLNEKVQESVHRIQPEELTLRAIEWARQLEIHSINIDLIYGLPHQTAVSFEKTLDEMIRISPERFAVFNFAYIPWMKAHQKLLDSEKLPTAERKLELLKLTIDKLTSAGYVYIGMDHFAKPDDELTIAQRNKTLYRNFQGYSTHADADLFGFGMSSISHFGTTYAQNEKTLDSYIKIVESGEFPTHIGYRMSKDDELRKYIILRLMCDLELDISRVERQFSIDFESYFANALEDLQVFIDEGLVVREAGRITIVGAGRLLLRNIAMCFDAYLKRMQQVKPIFSRTV